MNDLVQSTLQRWIAELKLFSVPPETILKVLRLAGFKGPLFVDTVAAYKKLSMQDALLQVVSNAASNIGKPVYSFLN